MNDMSPTRLSARPAPAAIEAVTRALAAMVGNRLVTSQAVREQHGHTLTWTPNQPPDAVVYPHSTEEVSAIVTLCSEHGVPVIAYGTGTSRPMAASASTSAR
jgi:D-lactate dehydrogenase (cytochrome)